MCAQWMWLGELTGGLGTVIATFVSLVWTALLSAEIFVLYDRSDRAQSEWSFVCVHASCVSTVHAQLSGNLVGVMIFVNAVTAVMPLVL